MRLGTNLFFTLWISFKWFLIKYRPIIKSSRFLLFHFFYAINSPFIALKTPNNCVLFSQMHDRKPLTSRVLNDNLFWDVYDVWNASEKLHVKPLKMNFCKRLIKQPFEWSKLKRLWCALFRLEIGCRRGFLSAPLMWRIYSARQCQ